MGEQGVCDGRDGGEVEPGGEVVTLAPRERDAFGTSGHASILPEPFGCQGPRRSGATPSPFGHASISVIDRRSLTPLALVVLFGACAHSAAGNADVAPSAEVDATSLSPTSVGPGAGTDLASSAAPTTSAWAPVTTGVGTTIAIDGQWRDFDDVLSAALVGKGAWGISVAVAKDGKVIHTAAMGVADPDTGRAATVADRYRLASNSKVLTAVSVLQLVESGALGLDDAVIARIARRIGLEGVAAGLDAITVRQLLNHTSGFGEYQKTFFNSRLDTCAEAAAVGLTNGLLNPPGADFTYSNMNYCLLGLLIEDVTGRPYEDVVRDSLLTPLGIDDMRMAGTHDVRDGDAHHLSGASRNYLEVLAAAGAWVGTAEDLVRIVDSLDPDRDGWHPVGRDTFDAMLVRADATFPYTSRWYGLGLRVWRDGAWGHTGTVENARSMVLHRPDGITWAVMVNGDAPSNTDRLRDDVDDALAEVGITTPD